MTQAAARGPGVCFLGTGAGAAALGRLRRAGPSAPFPIWVFLVSEAGPVAAAVSSRDGVPGGCWGSYGGRPGSPTTCFW